MIYLKTEEEIELMRISNQMVAKTLAEVGKSIKPGISTFELDKIAEEYIRDNGGVPGFLGYEGFPGSLCTSINENVVHGIPSKKDILKEGDIVSLDCGVYMNGFHGDSAYTFGVGEVDSQVKDLMKTTKESLILGVEQAVEGKRLGDIGAAVQQHCESKGYSVVREMIGHGIGRDLHEAPEVPNYGRKGNGIKLKTGMVICIEPMINLGTRNIVIERDGWTCRTKDRKPSAHYEHCVAIRKGKADILSSFEYIEKITEKK